MRLAETVTFGGSSLNRVAEIRGDAVELGKALSDASSRMILLWQGKPLLENGALVRLPLDHPIADVDDMPMILLGREESGAIFAKDISTWAPVDFDQLELGSFLDKSEQRHPLLGETQYFGELRGVMARLTPRDAEVAAIAKGLVSWHQSHRYCAKCGAGSEMVMAGWQRSCPDCGGQHFPRTDPVVIMLITRKNNVLMGRSHGWPEGMYSLLAGFVEPGETIEAAVRREVFEEANITVGPVGYLASQPWPYPTSLMFGCRGEALDDVITIDPQEIEDARWFSREEIAQSFAGQHSFLKPARKGAIAHFLLRNWLADQLD